MELADLTFILSTTQERVFSVPTFRQNNAQLLQVFKQQQQPRPIRQAAKSPTPQKVLEELIAAHSLLDHVTWRSGQKELFRRLGGPAAIGVGVARQLRRILTTYADDPISAARDSAEISNATTAFENKVRALTGALGPLVEELQPSPPPEGSKAIELRFKDEVPIQNLADLSQECGRWQRIFSGFSRARGESPPPVDVLDAGRGSFILLVSGASATVCGITFALTRIVRFLKEIEELKQMRSRTRTMLIAESALGTAFDAAIESQHENAIREIASETVSFLGNSSAAPVGNEEEIALNTSLRSLLEFTEKGGRVALPYDDNTEAGQELLSEIAKYERLVDASAVVGQLISEEST